MAILMWGQILTSHHPYPNMATVPWWLSKLTKGQVVEWEQAGVCPPLVIQPRCCRGVGVACSLLLVTFSSLHTCFASTPVHLTSSPLLTSLPQISSQFFSSHQSLPRDLISLMTLTITSTQMMPKSYLVSNIKLLFPTVFWNLLHTFFKLNISKLLSVPIPTLLFFPIS